MQRQQRLHSTGSSIPSDTGPAAGQSSVYRIVVMGAAAVGKTCIISRFLDARFRSAYVATVEEFHRATYNFDGGASLTLDILDTSGAYAFPAMRSLSISTGDAFVLVYSIDDEASFESVTRTRDEILAAKGGTDVPIVVVGNKSDVPVERRAVGKETAESMVNIDWEHGYVEASAKDNLHIVDIFQELLVQARVDLELSPAVRRRRRSLPAFDSTHKQLRKHNSCHIS